MDTLLRRYGVVILAALLAAASPGAWAQAQAAGRFVSVTGDVAIVGADGTRRSAERGGEIRQGDTIVTGPEALAQARMSDGGLISVRADSEFKLEQFSYKGREDRSASFVVNILKGGFRTITGLIAQVNRPGYRIATPAATIGVRGTHFEVVHVLPQIASPQVPAGTYNRVFEGITTVQNPAGGILQVVRDQTAFASLQGGSPTLVAPPALIFGRPTPVPRAALPQGDDKHKAANIKGEDRAIKMGRAFKGTDRAPAATPLESPTTVRSVPLTPIETTTIQVAPSTTTTLSPTTTTISPTLSTTTTLSPTTTSTSTLISPTTTTISPTLSTTTTLSPTTTSTSTLISPTTTTISPTLSTTTTLSPTTTISPTTTTTTTTSPLTSPTLSSPTLIKP